MYSDQSKCDGERPSCKTCLDHCRTCEYAYEPGLAPITALKRKFESLQAERADEQDLLRILRTTSEADAIKTLLLLRSSDDVQATLHRTRNPTGESSDIAASACTPLQADQQVARESDLQATCTTDVPSMYAPSLYPIASDSDGTPWSLPIEPYVR